MSASLLSYLAELLLKQPELHKITESRQTNCTCMITPTIYSIVITWLASFTCWLGVELVGLRSMLSFRDLDISLQRKLKNINQTLKSGTGNRWIQICRVVLVFQSRPFYPIVLCGNDNSRFGLLQFMLKLVLSTFQSMTLVGEHETHIHFFTFLRNTIFVINLMSHKLMLPTLVQTMSVTSLREQIIR